jgi:predicted ATPase
VLKLKRISTSGFKAVDQFSMSIEPKLTLLLGMNGAGKSSILQLFALMRDLANGQPDRFFEERGWDRKALRFRAPNNRSSIVRITAVFEAERWGTIRWLISWGLNSGRLQREHVQLWRTPHSEPTEIMTFDRETGGRFGHQKVPALRFQGSILSVIEKEGLGEEIKELLAELHAWLTQIRSLELLSPAAMKGNTRLSAGDMGGRGDRLAGFLAALRPEQRARVIRRVALFYPLADFHTTRKRAGWIDLNLSERFANFSTISSTQMSDGFMRLLALCAIPELPEVSLVLLDELEDGIEPHNLGQIVTLMTQETEAQIIATSHSPVLANVVGAESLRLISRTPEGRTVAARIDELPAFQVGREYFGPGELWTNTALNVLEDQALRVARDPEKGEADEL